MKDDVDYKRYFMLLLHAGINAVFFTILFMLQLIAGNQTLNEMLMISCSICFIIAYTNTAILFEITKHEQPCNTLFSQELCKYMNANIDYQYFKFSRIPIGNETTNFAILICGQLICVSCFFSSKQYR